MSTGDKHHTILTRRTLSTIFFLFGVLFLLPRMAKAQDCPPNIDFEKGDFTGWTCWIGSVSTFGNENVISLVPAGGPVFNQHTMYAAPGSSSETDYYGDFPVLCPNGSGHSVRLGNTTGGAQAEGLSYEFTIPPGRNTYSLIYNYAVVFQDPNHLAYQQPRLVLEVTDVTSNELISCSSFTFFPNGSPLPGFFQSSKSDSVAVWCKDWSAVSINLNNKAGKTIRLFFKTADCTFRRHFGYAYIDVNSECSSEFVGASYCPDDTAISVTAPFGYQQYTWFNQTFTQVLGTDQTINFDPPPPPGTTIAVEVVPYDGYGCLDTLYAQLLDTLNLIANAGPDVVSCNKEPVLIGSTPRQRVVYSWSPATGLSNPSIANPVATPAVTTQYILTTRSTGGGCVTTDAVTVTASIIDSSLTLLGKNLFCINTGDSAVFVVEPLPTIQWQLNGSPIPGANAPRYKVRQTGIYSAYLVNSDGCEMYTRPEQVTIEIPRPGIYYPDKYAVVNFPLQLQARSFGETAIWNPTVYLDDPSSVTPIFTSPDIRDQTYSIKITTRAGCVTTDRQVVKVIRDVKVFVPTAFTPNNDGLNDEFRPVFYGVKELNYFRVYNRWGQLVYDMGRDTEMPGWDGRINGTRQGTGVYVWTFRGLGLDGKTYTQKGTVTLIR